MALLASYTAYSNGELGLAGNQGGLQTIRLVLGTSLGNKSACCNCTLDRPKRSKLS